MKKIIFIFILLCFVISCADTTQKESTKPVNSEQKSTDKTREKQQTASIKKENVENLRNSAKLENNISTSDCLKVNTGDKLLLESQTFPFDFEPFKGSCFVTSHDAEYDDPPLGSEISLYKDGVQIYKFDSRFNPDSATCYVEAVAFEDLNKDNLQDVIVVGKCGAKSGELFANEVFINTGKGTFKTNTASNDKLEEFNKIEDVSNFVKKNKDIFFR